uniref:Non-haem dioxygenase N-terminal domain-containing protein n=1 Tax=Aegilops tauschii subsp. strangulata TaxID=200361 RepID=A0A453SC65_AEGTS
MSYMARRDQRHFRFSMMPSHCCHLFCTITLCQLENHGINDDLMDRTKELVNKHYDQNMENNFYSSEIAKTIGPDKVTSNVDWECSFMYHHQPKSNIHDIPELLR